MLKLLTLSSLYPNSQQPQHGIFVEQRLRHVLASGQAESYVVAPVPWFPLNSRLFGRYSTYASVPRMEVRHGIDIFHPRCPVVPKLGMNIAPWLMAAALHPVIQRFLRCGRRPDLIDAHYFYPDGVAATILGRRFQLPVVINALGSDINLFPRYPRPRKMILWAAESCAAIVTVSKALKRELRRLGVTTDKLTVLRNGIDLHLFHPLDRDAIRERMNLHGPTVVSVGRLNESKGHHIVIEALRELPDVRLIIVGEGHEEPRLRRLVKKLCMTERVNFFRNCQHDKLCEIYNAADVLVLATAREGMPNVVLEAMGCGTPVVATAVGGIPEILETPLVGRLVKERRASAFAAAIADVLATPPSRAAIRNVATHLSWEKPVEGQLTLFRSVAKAARRRVGSGLDLHRRVPGRTTQY